MPVKLDPISDPSFLRPSAPPVTAKEARNGLGRRGRHGRHDVHWQDDAAIFHAEARLKLSTIVDEVEAGREVELTRRGKPVAVVLSVREFERLRRERGNFGAAYEAFLEEHALNESGLERNFAASVRNRSRGPIRHRSPDRSAESQNSRRRPVSNSAKNSATR
jgi:prevent-host-death family protein